MNPLAIIPTYVRSAMDVEVLKDCLESLRGTTPNGSLDILVVDDASPDVSLREVVYTTAAEYEALILQRPVNEGFSKTVNVGLRKALDDGRDAILINADVEMMKAGWLQRAQQTERLHGEGPADVVGALLVYPNGLIQHGGTYFSLLTRDFQHTWQYAPMNLPAALKPSVCPVTGAFQYIRHETLERVGTYDERFRMGMEDVDFCLRVLKEGMECVYQPKVKAWHHESLFRGRRSDRLDRWHKESFIAFMEKWQDQNFAGLVPNL
jgi:GT2 family glycosyltransferase